MSNHTHQQLARITELPPIQSTISVRLVDGVIVTGVVTGHGQKDSKPTFDFEYDHRTNDGKILKASKWAWPEQVQRERKIYTVGDGYAVMILVGQRMGLDPARVEDAKRQLEGGATHPIVAAAIEKEAILLNNRLRHDAELISKANLCAENVKAEYGFVM